jgi:hypothetical protein
VRKAPKGAAPRIENTLAKKTGHEVHATDF